MKQNETSRVHVPSPRGVLALLVLPSSNRFAVHAAALGRNESTHRLHYFDHDPNAPRLNKIQSHKRQRKQTQTHEYDEDLEIQALNVFGLHVTPTVHVRVPYHPSQGEFTLIYFCDMNCRHSTRFTKILANFMQAVQKDDHYENENTLPIQLICVLNDEINLSATGFRNELRNGPPNILSHLVSETACWCLGYDHINRLAMIRMLSISMVPSLIVINNETGRVITSCGMEAIEGSAVDDHGSKHLLAQWRKGNDGIPFSTKIINSCSII